MAARTWLPLDLVLVGVFAVVGRLSHYGSLSLDSWWTTAWPFLAGTVLAWAALLLTRRPAAAIGSGLVVWLGALVGGMVLRQASGLDRKDKRTRLFGHCQHDRQDGGKVNLHQMLSSPISSR